MHSKFMLMFRQLSIERWNQQPTRESKKWPASMLTVSYSKRGLDC